MDSLDPRVNRLPKGMNNTDPKIPLDQFGTFEVFVQPKDGKPFQHEGIVHAPNIEMGYVLAKETFTRRFTCVSIFITATTSIFVSKLTEGDDDAYNHVQKTESEGTKVPFEIFHLYKRGKQHIQVGIVEAADHNEALWMAKQQLKPEKQVYNIWAIRTSDIRYTNQVDLDFWNTLSEKKFRDAAAYKGGDKLKTFLERTK